MFAPFFYHGQIRKYTAVFGSLFSDIKIARYAADKTVDKYVQVPLSYSSQQKEQDTDDERRDRHSGRDRRMGISLPRMGFNFIGLTYDGTRKTHRLNTIAATAYDQGQGQRSRMFNRVPYNFEFELLIKTKNLTDMTQIVEQIVPFFDPTLTVKIDDLDPAQVDMEQAINIRITSIEPSDVMDESMESTRSIEWRIGFELEGYLYKNVLTDPIITQIDIQVNDEGDQPGTYTVIASTLAGDQTSYYQTTDNLTIIPGWPGSE